MWQITELYEYSKVLGNSQFVLQPFQPYKLVYAYMLAEVGKVSDSLKYVMLWLVYIYIYMKSKFYDLYFLQVLSGHFEILKDR